MKARLLVAVLVLSAPLAFGDHPRLAGHQGCSAKSADARLAQQLSLNDEQTEKVHGLHTAYALKQQQLRQTFRATRVQLREARQAGDDEQQAKARETLRSIRTQMKTHQTELDKEIAGVLTDEQRAKWDVIKSERRPRRVR